MSNGVEITDEREGMLMARGLVFGLLAALVCSVPTFAQQMGLQAGRRSPDGIGRARAVAEVGPLRVGFDAGRSERNPSESVRPATAMVASPAHCDNCGKALDACICANSITIYADWLYLQPRGSDLGYAYPTDEAFGRPLGPTSQIDYDYEPEGFRVGGMMPIGDGPHTYGITYTRFKAGTNSSAFAAPGGTLQTLLLASPSPLTADAASTGFAIAHSEVDFNLFDTELRHYFCGGCDQGRLYGFIGSRIATLDQMFNVTYDRDVVHTAQDLRGAGVRGGIGGSTTIKGIKLFGSVGLSVLATEIETMYRQTNNLAGRVVDYRQDIDRVLPVLDLELGVGLDIGKHCSVSVGYLYSVWFNVVTPEQTIQAVQAGDFTGDIEDDLTFDGFFTRFEVNW